MAPDFKDWKAQAAKTASTGPFGLTAAQWAESKRLSRLAIVKLDDLTASDPWLVYRASVEAMLAQDRAALETKQAEILAPTAVGERLLTLKLEAAELAGRIAAREEDLAVPAQWKAQAGEGAA